MYHALVQLLLHLSINVAPHQAPNLYPCVIAVWSTFMPIMAIVAGQAGGPDSSLVCGITSCIQEYKDVLLMKNMMVHNAKFFLSTQMLRCKILQKYYSTPTVSENLGNHF